ncbi:hypothetical protein, partial [Endozoicomonas sp. ONNA2]|uniref:hypothetical protein n=1 Tax=Endozoicomonas sp. ONNA2 TaxID=2828741 RepID=UPI0021476F3C
LATGTPSRALFSDSLLDATRRLLPEKLESLVLLRAAGGNIFPDSLSKEVFTNPCNNGDGTTTATLMHGMSAGGDVATGNRTLVEGRVVKAELPPLRCRRLQGPFESNGQLDTTGYEKGD